MNNTNFTSLILLLITFISCSSPNQSKQQSMLLDVPFETDSTKTYAEPYLMTTATGQTYMSWIEEGENGAELRYAYFDQGKWKSPQSIASGNNWFINWADYPQIASKDGKSMLSFFLQKSGESTYAYDIQFMSSLDGKNWSAPKTLHDDGLQAEHGFVSMLSYDENYLVSWLDGRNSAGQMDQHNHQSGSMAAMTLRAAILSPEGKKLQEWEIDNRTCDCCQTSVALTNNGPVVVYRDRGITEVRDIAISRLINGEWTQPKTIFQDNWQIKGCPVNGPRAASKNNSLAVAWFSAAKGQPEVKVIFSTDGGENFEKPIKINMAPSIGRVDIVMIDESTAYVSWMEKGEIKAKKVHQNGTSEEAITIAKTTEERASGFPQMTIAKEGLLFAWTDTEGKGTRIKSKLLKTH
ncbi:exo-alpha-sialidase [Echinicola marina]|uniref:exo-alpha-sialidase n=1 Tax=Echinicola marina TaxID=2859768 RepID=UPI001CF638E4|nr:exo-alpha-sialidase [Echinicola marina]UCS92747.1 exo-alpha-sialidase [Echinicola marina]